MSTSFRRTSDKNDIKSTNTIFEGVKLYTNSQYITSTGLRKLDEIFGGGVILGSFVLIEEDDHFSHHSATLLSYAYINYFIF
jgi:predicted ATP-dependent serine protease